VAEAPVARPNPAAVAPAQNGDGDAAALAAPAQAQAQANGQPEPPAPTPPDAASNDGIAGMSALRGLLVYGAVLTFAGLFTDFMVRISTAKSGVTPGIDSSMIAAAAALAGVLGSAFALKVGVSPNPSQINTELANHVQAAKDGKRARTGAIIRKVLSLEPSAMDAKSWPLTFGIWAYAVVASATAAVFILNQRETPSSVRALAVAFGGYVLTLLNVAYGLNRSKANQ
jgi:hypothetical protein